MSAKYGLGEFALFPQIHSDRSWYLKLGGVDGYQNRPKSFPDIATELFGRPTLKVVVFDSCGSD